MAHVVQLAEGKISGGTRTDLNGDKFHSFLCIPYGKAPVGDLRFKAPLPVDPWEGVKQVITEDKTPFQKNIVLKEYTGEEDCLSLHVFTKKLPHEESKLKPVMVYIHGGGFIMGSHETTMYGPEYLMTEDIVLVSITYRVGLLGFLSIEDESLDVPGNAGLKDQVLALKWVQRNIRNFNGDPNNITIFGESAGGASVEFLLLSPSAKGLFHKAILQSGSTLNPWTLKNSPATEFAEFTKLHNLPDIDILKSLRRMTVRELYDQQNQYIKSKKLFVDFGLITPVIEKPNPTAFLTEKPIDIIQSGKYNNVPVIMGYTDSEGLLLDFLSALGMNGAKEGEDIPIEQILPYETNLTDAQQVKRLVEKLRNFYRPEADPVGRINLSTDALFAAGIITSAKNQAKVSKNPVYFYRFSLDAGLNMLKKMVNDTRPGACHGDELGYLFKNLLTTDIGDEDKTYIHRMVTLWTNFAKYGNPTPPGNNLNIEWKPIQNGQLNFLDIGKQLKMDVNPDADRMKIWNELYQCNPLTAKY
ncbi:juvenile hormone esterase isoform X2 [Diabrotica virgifera virgifera]|nr:juvenile hormone esterase isoform X2 [Diabrotica virgifera virgifera]XP_050504992.1 juvenile hormone esterase isoform X2 [Diabrotica virgifera virgifera]ALP46202.1 esterase [Diabrotica virgifera virgifera]